VLELVSLLVHMLDHLLFERRLRPRVKNLARRLCSLRWPRVLAPGALPPGTASAIASAIQPLAERTWSPVPQLVNSSLMMQWEGARQQRIAAQVAAY
jgi:hypothetical protein